LILTFLLISHCLMGTEINKNSQEVATTIDDLPFNSKMYPDTLSRKKAFIKLLKTLTSYQVPVIGFVNEKKLYKNNYLDQGKVEMLNLWVQAGLELGNHTFSHPDLHKTALEDFKEDVIRGEPITKNILKKNGKTLQFFRHPYLHTGLSLAIKKNLEVFLDNRGYRIAPISIDNSEWIFASAYEKTLMKKDTQLIKKIVSAYITYMDDMFAYFEDQSRRLLGYEIKQILLIHANLLNAHHLDLLLKKIRTRGYTFITLSRALTDKAYKSKDTYTGPAGITWLHRWALTRGKKGEFFKGEPEVPEFVKDSAKSLYR